MNGRPIMEDDLHGFVDQTLDARRQAEVAAYLEQHPDVAKRVAGFCDQRDMLRSLFASVKDEPVPPELNLTRMIEMRGLPRRIPWWAAAAAIVALLCTGGLGGWFLHGASDMSAEGIASLAQEAADSYAVYASDEIRPVELRADNRQQLVDWASQRIGRPIAIPDLAKSGYRFMGGRVVATAHGPATLLMYDDDRGARLVMLVRPMATEQNKPMQPHVRGPVNGFTWADKGMGYSLVGPASPDALHPIADEMRRQISREI